MITDELVEAVARAMCDTWGYLWDGEPDDEQTAPETCIDVTPGKVLYREAARAALTAVLPMIRGAVVEECAAVVDVERNKPGLIAGSETARDRALRIGWLVGGQHFAAAIRAMKGNAA